MREIQAPAAEPPGLREFRDTLWRHALYLTDAVSSHCAWTWHLRTQPPLGNQHHDSAGNTLPYDPARLGLLAQYDLVARDLVALTDQFGRLAKLAAFLERSGQESLRAYAEGRPAGPLDPFNVRGQSRDNA